MAANLHQVTVLADLPKFCGNRKDGDPPFIKEVDARAFLRSMENYFDNHQVQSDEKKLQIFYANIDKTKGDAIDFITAYVGSVVPFNDIKEEFLIAYPGTGRELRSAAKALMATRLEDKFSNTYLLEARARAVAEALLENQDLTEGIVGLGTRVVRGNQFTLQVPPEAGVVPEEEGVPAPPTYAIPPNTGLQLVKLIQFAFMHVMTCDQAPAKVYEKVAKIGMTKSSTRLTAEINNATQMYLNTHRPKKAPPREPAPTIWGLETTAERPSKSPKSFTTYPKKNDSAKCFNCDRPGHHRRNCPYCGYCKASDHTAKNCKKRIADSKDKYCKFCRIKDSHSFEECRRRRRPNQRRGNVRMLHEEQEDEDSPSYDPTTYEDDSESDDLRKN